MIRTEWKPWYTWVYTIAMILAAINVTFMILQLSGCVQTPGSQTSAPKIEGLRITTTPPLTLVTKIGSDFEVEDDSRVVTMLHFCDDGSTVPYFQDDTQIEFTYTEGTEHVLGKDGDVACKKFLSARVLHAPYDDGQQDQTTTTDDDSSKPNDCDKQDIKTAECQETSK